MYIQDGEVYIEILNDIPMEKIYKVQNKQS